MASLLQIAITINVEIAVVTVIRPEIPDLIIGGGQNNIVNTVSPWGTDDTVRPPWCIRMI